jgi:hypothetical protein
MTESLPMATPSLSSLIPKEVKFESLSDLKEVIKEKTYQKHKYRMALDQPVFDMKLDDGVIKAIKG